MKIVINAQYGGFGLSKQATKRYFELTGKNVDRHHDRADPYLVQIVEELGLVAGDQFASLKIVEVPDDVDWQIEEYDGKEWVAEKHRVWD